MSCFFGCARFRRDSVCTADAGERFVDVHGVQQWLVIASLELVGTDQEAIGILTDFLDDLVARKTVERGFRDLVPAILVFA